LLTKGFLGFHPFSPPLGDKKQRLSEMLLAGLSVDFATLKREINWLNKIALVCPAMFEPATFSSGDYNFLFSVIYLPLLTTLSF
jgi:hypothetical protein